MGLKMKGIAALCVVFIAFVVFKVQRDPVFILDIADFVNSFDDFTAFNKVNNTYLNGVYAPVGEESLNIPAQVISGEIPKDVTGLFLRVGPNPIEGHASRRYHWFDGHGMIHSIRLGDGKAVYSNQWVHTPRFLLEREYNRPIFLLLGEMKGLLGLFKMLVVAPVVLAVFKVGALTQGTANTAMLIYNNQLYACHEGSLPFRIQWQPDNTFRSVGYESLDGALNHAVTAHGKVDPVDGGLYFNGYRLDGDTSGMKYGALVGDTLNRYVSIDEPVKSFAHDMMITENYAIFFESSVLFQADIDSIMSGQFFHFNETHKMRVGVMPKNGTSQEEVRWFTADRAYSVIHAMNAWEVHSVDAVTGEAKDEIVIYAPIGYYFDGIDPEETDDKNEFFLAEMRIDMTKPPVTRPATPNLAPTPPPLGEPAGAGVTTAGASPAMAPVSAPAMAEVQVQVVDPNLLVEFPRVHPQLLGRPSRYGFAGRFAKDGSGGFSHIVKFDLFAKQLAASIRLPEGLVGGEPVPVPKQPLHSSSSNSSHSKAEEEDGGVKKELSDDIYLAIMAHNTATNTGEWLLYDGTTMSPEPVVRLSLGGRRVPNGFHGEWIPEHVLQAHLEQSNMA